MVVLSKSAIVEAAAKYPAIADALYTWYHTTKQADWASFNELKADKPSTDQIGNDRYVFNVKTHRLIAMIFFDIRTVYIREVMTHTDYDRRRNSLPTL